MLTAAPYIVASNVSYSTL